MSDHPVRGLLQTAMQNLDGVVDANSTIGKPIETSDGTVIIPIIKKSMNFVAGGSEFGKGNGHSAPKFGGGAAGSLSITPVAFLILSKTGVQTVSLEAPHDIYIRMIEAAPQLLEKIKSLLASDSVRESE